MHFAYSLLVNNMLDIIKSYFNKETYYIILTSNAVYLKNYNKILNIDSEEAVVEINGRILKITGEDLVLNKIVSKEAAIKGKIESVKYL